MKKNKKTIIILVLVFLLVAIGVGMYFGLKQLSQQTRIQSDNNLPIAPSQYETTTSPTEGLTADMTQVESYEDQDIKSLTQLTKGPVVDYFLVQPRVFTDWSAENPSLKAMVFYVKDNGDIIRIISAGNEELYFSLGLSPLRIIQNNDGSFLVMRLLSGRYIIFNVLKKVFELLPDGVMSASFSPDGTKLAYLVSDSKEKSNLFIQSIGLLKNENTKLFSLNLLDVSVFWASKSELYLIPPESFHASQTVWRFNINSQTIESFAVGSGIGVVFSSVTSSAILFQNNGPTTVSVRVVDTPDSSTLKTTAPFSTFRSKCAFAFDSNDAFCAVPQKLSRSGGIILPDDYNAFRVFTNDYLYILKGAEGYQSNGLLMTTQIPFDAKQIHAMNNQLYFVNRLNDSLYVFSY